MAKSAILKTYDQLFVGVLSQAFSLVWRRFRENVLDVPLALRYDKKVLRAADMVTVLNRHDPWPPVAGSHWTRRSAARFILGAGAQVRNPKHGLFGNDAGQQSASDHASAPDRGATGCARRGGQSRQNERWAFWKMAMSVSKPSPPGGRTLHLTRCRSGPFRKKPERKLCPSHPDCGTAHLSTHALHRGARRDVPGMRIPGTTHPVRHWSGRLGAVAPLVSPRT